MMKANKKKEKKQIQLTAAELLAIGAERASRNQVLFPERVASAKAFLARVTNTEWPE